ncbi:hypothetical protein VPNG_07730 [Cytospora leucostoma]|uniref:AAA+ ATPase domain-containing protein n=1 Tax=Cytospora leucostoma TaxID=1230097 RepID=A0A423W8G9_9PEZI|nr:hypothetical protein VPNG_07730 [Cytospora leucostoma]
MPPIMSSTIGTSTAVKSATDVKLQLPELEFERHNKSPDLALGMQISGLTARTLATAMSRRCSLRSIKDYLQGFPRQEVERIVKHMVRGHCVLTYAVDTDNVEVLQLLLEYSFDVNIFAHDSGNVPLLAFSIMRAEKTGFSNHEILRMLLAHGADPMAIPRSMWQDYRKVPHAFVTEKHGITPAEEWCTQKHREALVRTLDMTTRYLLWLASRLSPPTKRLLQIAVEYKATGLLKLPLQIIGQQSTIRMITNEILSHVGSDVAKPLIMAFAGPSGHGKTELAMQMGAMLSVPMINLDCTHIKDDFALFGSTLSYRGNEEGTHLNNFLAENEGKRCVVFLDEFEKTDKSMHQSLLKLMEEGWYCDRRLGRSHDKLDCTRVIWILATNLGDRDILGFHASNMEGRKDEDLDKVSLEHLKKLLAQTLNLRLTSAVASRIKIIAPFLPFSPGEREVVAHKFLTSLKRELRRPIKMDKPQRLYVGHVDLQIVNDGKICKYLAEGYNKEQGARSIEKSVMGVRPKVFSAYCQTDVLVTEEINDGPLIPFTLQLNPVTETEDELSVFEEGIAH